MLSLALRIVANIAAFGALITLGALLIPGEAAATPSGSLLRWAWTILILGLLAVANLRKGRGQAPDDLATRLLPLIPVLLAGAYGKHLATFAGWLLGGPLSGGATGENVLTALGISLAAFGAVFALVLSFSFKMARLNTAALPRPAGLVLALLAIQWAACGTLGALWGP